MFNNNANTQTPLFYTPTPPTQKVSVSRKIQSWLTQWRVEQLQARIEDIQDALEYELRQNHSHKRQHELAACAQQMCLNLAQKQQRLLQR